uniref:ATPase phospholipid transporting 8B5a n=1 Tax=Labrus bergylta TaxID=56723 RepID=A0A3Q3ESJ5_9LABR
MHAYLMPSFQADLLLLSSSEPLNLVYIETVRCEPPNNRLDRFTGTLTFAGQKYPLDNEKILLRGCTLRNTDWCFGLVLFGGGTDLSQTRIDKKKKKSSGNCQLIFGFLAFMCTILAIGNLFWEVNEGSQFTVFLPRQNDNKIIRLGNSFYIDWDRKMYYGRKDTPAEARTTTLNEELGQIKYIFSDKTGTLTQNIMVFNKCSINERVDFSFNRLADPRFMFHDHALVEAVKLENPEVHAFFRLLALCHTVMAEEKREGEIYYQAQSPDEGALVTAARNFGFVFRSRTPDSVSIVEMGQQCSYELLAILDFNNVRKRMSVIVRSPEGKLSLYCKGADTIIYERLDQSCSKLMEVTTEHLNEFAGDGLRTLALAYKDLDEEYFNQWKQRHHEVSTALDGREEKLDELYEEIEKDLLLLGATAIEDKLQDGVPQTIEQLSKADIKIWVLTGDKQGDIFITQTKTFKKYRIATVAAAVVGIVQFRCYILGSYTMFHLIYIPPMFRFPQAYALEHSLEQEFLKTACMCKAVICCRVTPLQKAQVVELVKKYKKAVTLAIGDGANDVSMIKGIFSMTDLRT